MCESLHVAVKMYINYSFFYIIVYSSGDRSPTLLLLGLCRQLFLLGREFVKASVSETCRTVSEQTVKWRKSTGRIAMFEKTCATSQKSKKSCFFGFSNKRLKT